MQDLPWLELESYATGQQLYRMVEKIVKRHRRRLPVSAHKLRSAASRIGGKLARSTVTLGGTVRPLLDRAKALRAARYVLWSLRNIQRLERERDVQIVAAIEITERVIDLIRSGR